MPRTSELPTIEERTFEFALSIIRAYREKPPRDEADRVIWRQLLKSGSSAGANSAEGPGSQTRREWMTRRHIALKEMRESQFWLRLMRDSDLRPSPPLLASLIDESSQLVAILTAALNTAQRNDKRSQPG